LAFAAVADRVTDTLVIDSSAIDSPSICNPSIRNPQSAFVIGYV